MAAEAKGAKCAAIGVADSKHYAADPSPNQTFHFDADQDSDATFHFDVVRFLSGIFSPNRDDF